tara:strand:- start:212 stop:769 length:558 start_codon:yes stop_codon:yes gene_type:complete
MAFKMNRPFKMNGPLKRSTTIKIGAKKGIGKIDTDVDSGSTAMFYNSKMGPMQMMSPSALKQVEEATDETFPSGETKSERDQFNDQETSNEMEKEGGENSTIPGQDIIAGEGEESGEFWFDTGGNDQIYIEDPNGIVAENSSDGYVNDVDFLYEQTEDGYYKVIGVADVSEGSEFEEGVPGTQPQ